ncbi:MAG TPA: 3-methyladenine DNA glycosylase [Nitratifractor sp.]|nr:3-methyladenine DNA glycosylase [Nitratifractor sp.]
MISSSTELFLKLKSLGYDNSSRDPWWWPQSGRFEVVLTAILTQNTSWNNVEKALANLESSSLVTLDALANSDIEVLQELIRPSGFYKAKSKNILQLSKNIVESCGTFEAFQELVIREWLLEQRGIGPESADAILNYACYKEAFVVDSYTNRLLFAFGYSFESYDALQEWIVEDFYSGYEELFPNLSRAQAYARAHGMVVEYCKVNKRGKEIDITMLRETEKG